MPTFQPTTERSAIITLFAALWHCIDHPTDKLIDTIIAIAPNRAVATEAFRILGENIQRSSNENAHRQRLQNDAAQQRNR